MHAWPIARVVPVRVFARLVLRGSVRGIVMILSTEDVLWLLVVGVIFDFLGRFLLWSCSEHFAGGEK